MKTLEERLAETKQKYEKEQAETIKRYEVMKQVMHYLEGYYEPMVYFYKLYGRIGSIHVHGCEYESIRKGKNPNADLLRLLLEKFPPVRMMKVKDGCTSFRPDTDENNEQLREGADVYECHSVIVKVETFQHRVADFEWTAEIDGDLYAFSVRFPWHITDL